MILGTVSDDLSSDKFEGMTGADWIDHLGGLGSPPGGSVILAPKMIIPGYASGALHFAGSEMTNTAMTWSHW